MSKFREAVQKLLADEGASSWVKLAIQRLNDRDVVDALNDLEVLQDLLMLKFDEALIAVRSKKGEAA